MSHETVQKLNLVPRQSIAESEEVSLREDVFLRPQCYYCRVQYFIPNEKIAHELQRERIQVDETETPKRKYYGAGREVA